MEAKGKDQFFKVLAGPCVRVCDPSERNEVLAAADAGRVRVFHVDASAAHSKETVLRALAQAFEFPQYFGVNWDALEECIRDLSWLPRQDFALVVDNADDLLGLSSSDLDTLIRVLANTTLSWQAESRKFCVILLGGHKLADAVNGAGCGQR